MNDYLSTNYKIYTDKYFLRAKSILQQEDINPVVRYQIFVRKNIESLEGVNGAIQFIKSVVGDKVRIYALAEGKPYVVGQPIMKLEGRIQDLIDLETIYLGILSGSLSGRIDLEKVRINARAIVAEAGDKKVLYFGARHFFPWLDKGIAKICCEEGFTGCSTDDGATAWDAEGGGTIPHALVLAYGVDMRKKGIQRNPTVEATKGFDRCMDKSIPRVALIDTFNKESYDSIAVGCVLSNLSGVRIDTCGENKAAVTRPHAAVNHFSGLSKYAFGNGVTISAVWGLRRDLDEADLEHVKITVSSGFNSRKVSAFMEADRAYQNIYGKPLFDSIGTGSLYNAVMATSDIVAYYSEIEEQWVSYSKTGRAEMFSSEMKEVE